jgi:hypothetical protein
VDALRGDPKDSSRAGRSATRLSRGGPKSSRRQGEREFCKGLYIHHKTLLLKRQAKKSVNMVPDLMPAGRQDATGRYISADHPKDALVIADSKYTWDSAKRVAVDDQVRGMLVLAKQNNVPFVFLLKKSGDISDAVKRCADELGVTYEVVRDVTGTIL